MSAATGWTQEQQDAMVDVFNVAWVIEHSVVQADEQAARRMLPDVLERARLVMDWAYLHASEVLALTEARLNRCPHCGTPLADRGDGPECPGCVEKARGE